MGEGIGAYGQKKRAQRPYGQNFPEGPPTPRGGWDKPLVRKRDFFNKLFGGGSLTEVVDDPANFMINIPPDLDQGLNKYKKKSYKTIECTNTIM